ncbi:TIGR01777 family oxidoreductase [Planctomicrobium sp. SH661]|uniref:TIGR01777 family oxidoreductase n=1 Tax=Planctomicrobium sp. SH661 TaxID=3448124 RepID=UPI003F5BFF42
MHIFVTGSTGLIGRELVSTLEASGHQVTRLVRGVPANERERSWETGGRRLSATVLEGCDVLVHLAGESIASGRWTQHKKDRIYHSRVDSTAILSDAMTRLPIMPKAFIVASAIGYYGDRGESVLTESSPPGVGFLADVCKAWESAADPVREQTRVVHVRTSMVLSEKGGAIKPMLLPFKMGVGGVIGSGEQYWSWITLEDIVRLFQFAIENENLRGPINGATPNPVTNREFTTTLGERLHRPTVLPMPGFIARIALGEMANDLILASTRVVPEVPVQQGFQFRQPELKAALASLPL